MVYCYILGSGGDFFPVTLIYISVLFEKEHIKTKKCILAFFYAFFCVIGIYIKPQVAIVVIAMGIVKLLQCLAKDVKNIYINIDIWGAMVLGAVLVVIAYNVIIVPSFRINIDKQLRFGISHYLMMGLNDSTDGVFSEDDVDFSISYLNKEDRILANIEESKSRLADYGVVGLFRHLNRKMLVNYGDGTFSWFVEGGFIADIPSWNYDEKALENYLWIIPEGTGYKKYISFAQTIWLLLLILCIFAGMFGSDNEYYLLLKLIIIGITLFVLLFEARARYLFMFSPIYVLMSAKGLDNIYVIYRKHL